MKLGLVVLSVFALSFGPLLAAAMIRRDSAITPGTAAIAQLTAIFGRLFPFKRGLVHAYWAGNFWALYVFSDRVLAFGLRFAGVGVDMAAAQSATRGLVEDVRFAVLPDIRPGMAALVTLLAMIVSNALVRVDYWLLLTRINSCQPSLWILWNRPTFPLFLRTHILCAYSSFLFGWHVHEKAVLLILIPFTLLCFTTRTHAKLYLTASLSGYYGLFPLLFGGMEWVLKCCVAGGWMVGAHWGVGVL
jgi:alpha-1,3-glucosyltransferase